MTYQTPHWAEGRESEIIRIPIFPELTISWESGDEDRLSEASAAALDCEDWGRQDCAVYSCSQVTGRRVSWGGAPGKMDCSNPVQCPEEGVEGNTREAFLLR